MTWDWMGGVDPHGWRPAGGQWNKKQAFLCWLANCSRFSEGPLAAGVTSGFQALVGNRLLLTVDLGTAVSHDKEHIAGISHLLWALDGEADTLAHTGGPGLCCSSIYFMRLLRGCYPALCMGKDTHRPLVQSHRLCIWVWGWGNQDSGLDADFSLPPPQTKLPLDTPPTVHTHRRADLTPSLPAP